MEGLSNIALVTGGSRGIGRAVALALAADGFDIFFTYRNNHEEAGKTVSEIAASGRTARAFCVDSSDPAQVARFFEDEMLQNAGSYSFPCWSIMPGWQEIRSFCA